MKSVLLSVLFLSLISCVSRDRENRAQLVGEWRYVDAEQSCDYSFKPDGSFTGKVKYRSKIVSKFNGRWNVTATSILYTYVKDAFDRIPAGTTDRDQLLDITEDSFLIRAANGDRRRYTRVR